MYKINFSFIFDNEFERVFDTFKETQSNIDIALKNLISNVKFYKGSRFNEENSEFSFCWKNYYQIKVVVENVINENLFKTYTFKSIYIDKLPIQISFIFQFFRDSVNEKTIFIFVIEYSDNFFGELIKDDFNVDDLLTICKSIEDFLNESKKGLEEEFTCVVNSPIEQARKYILNPNLYYQIVSKGAIFTTNEHDVYSDEIYEMFTKLENTSNPIPLTTFIVDSLYISEPYIKIIYKTYKRISFPNIKIILILKQLANNKSFNSLYIKTYEPMTHEKNCQLLHFWKKRIFDYYSFFEKKNKNKINLNK